MAHSRQRSGCGVLRRLVACTLVTGLSGACGVLLGAQPSQCASDSDCPQDGQGLICVDALCVASSDASTGMGSTDATSTTAATTDGGSDSSGSTTGAPEGPWGCLALAPPIPPQPQPGVTHLYRGRVIDTITQVPPADVAIRMCDALDVECTTPVLTGIPVDPVDGAYEMQVPSGFEGYLEITSSATVPQILWMAGPVTEDLPGTDVPLQLVSPGIRDSLIQTAGYENDETRGLILLVATDCMNATAAGVNFSIDTLDDLTVPFYLYGLLPELETQFTDDSGFGGFFNAPPGFTTVDSKVFDTDEAIDSSRFLVRAGWISAVAAGPAQAQ